MKFDQIFFQKMVKSYSAYGCTNRFSKNGISFHKFPLKDKSLLRKWIVATKRENFQPTFNRYLCGEHFLPSIDIYVASILSLPCPSSLANWTSSVNCEPGFFLDVFTFLQERAKDDLSYRDCALICDGMYIKAGVVYNQSDGCYDGFVNFGTDISATDPDVIATEVLVFMLVGLQGHWKVPIGYVLINSITATTLYCLISKALSLASCHGLNSISCDGYPSNITSM